MGNRTRKEGHLDDKRKARSDEGDIEVPINKREITFCRTSPSPSTSAGNHTTVSSIASNPATICGVCVYICGVYNVCMPWGWVWEYLLDVIRRFSTRTHGAGHRLTVRITSTPRTLHLSLRGDRRPLTDDIRGGDRTRDDDSIHDRSRGSLCTGRLPGRFLLEEPRLSHQTTVVS